MLKDPTRFDALCEEFDPEDLGDVAAAEQMTVLRHHLSARYWSIVRDRDARAGGGPHRAGPRVPDERGDLIALIDHRVSGPILPYMRTSPPGGGVSRERTEFRTNVIAYNTLLMGVPEIFMGFESGSRTERFADMMSIPPTMMREWQAVAKKRARAAAGLRHDALAAALWLSRWHPGMGLERRHRLVPEPYRAKVRAIGMVSYIVGRERLHIDEVERLMLTHELKPGERGSTPARLVAHDPERWVCRLPAIAHRWMGE